MFHRVVEWFETSYKKSAAYGKANAFVEDEPLFGSCGTSIVAARAWGETFLAQVRQFSINRPGTGRTVRKG